LIGLTLKHKKSQKTTTMLEHTLPALHYAFDALEPHIDAQTMQIHHDKHHQAYVDNLNKALAGTDGFGKTLEELMENISAYTTIPCSGTYWATMAASPQASSLMLSIKPSARSMALKKK
jgi:superoxide dismutase